MKLIFKILSILFAILILSLVGFFMYIKYQTRTRETVVLEQKDKKGRLIKKKVEGYDCCEGFFERTYIYDTLGNLLSEFGIQDRAEYRVDIRYNSAGKENIRKRYDWIKDESFGLNTDSILSSVVVSEYENTERLSGVTTTYFYWEDYDTLSVEKLGYGETGDTILWTVLSYERGDYKSNDTILISYNSYKILENKLTAGKDTLEILEIIK